MANNIRVFVYGTLKRGYGNHNALDGATYLGRTTIKGKFQLLDLGWYPGVVEHDSLPEREIGGELYQIDDDTLATLDMIEGHPSFYERKRTPTQQGAKAWVYFLPEAYLQERKPIETLFWRQNNLETEWVEGGRETA